MMIDDTGPSGYFAVHTGTSLNTVLELRYEFQHYSITDCICVLLRKKKQSSTNDRSLYATKSVVYHNGIRRVYAIRYIRNNKIGHTRK